MSNFNFTCPHCQSQMSFPYAAVGQQGKCSGCQQVVTIQPDPTPVAADPVAKKTIIIAAIAAGAVGIAILCISGSLLFYLNPQGYMSIPFISDKTDFDTTGEKIFNALRERSTAKLQSHIFNNVVLKKIRAEIREGVPESLQTAYDETDTRTNKLNAFSDRDLNELSSVFIGFFSNEESRYPKLKSQWQNIEYIGIVGGLPTEREGTRERFIDNFKLNFDYSGSYDPDLVIRPTLYFRLDDEIYRLSIQEVLMEFDGKWYGFGDRAPRIIKITEKDFTDMPPVDEMSLMMYGGTEKVLIRLGEELGFSSTN
jgi:hypothetical protein